MVGLVALCAGIGLLDSVDTGRVGRRQVGLFLVCLGGVVGMWSLVVTILLAMLGLPAQPTVLSLLAGGALAVGAAVYLLRYAPTPERAAEPPAVAPRRTSATERRPPSRAPVIEELRRLAG
jgi:hypothetical protein